MTSSHRAATSVPDPALDRVAALRAALAAAPLPLALRGTAPVRAQRAELLQQLEDYLVPRLAAPDRPLLVVVGGPTGVGKSTLVNTLVGEQVSQSSMIRPTTRSPVLIHHPSDRGWFGRDGILPAFDRVEEPTDDPGALQVVPHAAVPAGVALLDAPDFDSIDDANRVLATRLLAAADMWLFVTSAARYADQLPWEQLDIARARETPLIVVMNRIPAEDLATVSVDLAEQLEVRGIGRGKLVFVEHGPVERGLLRSPQVAEIREALEALSASPALRHDIARQCVDGAVRQAGRVARRVADAADRQVAAIGELLTLADRTYDEALTGLTAALTDGTVLRGDLLGQWQDLVGTAEALPMTEMVRRVRERVVALPAHRQEPLLGRLEVALDLALEGLVVDHAERAAGETARVLRGSAYGEALLDWSEEDLARPGRRLGTAARQAVAAWRRGLATDPSARAIGLALAVCAVAAPSADRGAAPGPVAAARTGIVRTAGDLLAAERARYLEPVLGWSLTPDAPGRLRTAAAAAVRLGARPREGPERWPVVDWAPRSAARRSPSPGAERRSSGASPVSTGRSPRRVAGSTTPSSTT
ncbi:GTPase [Nocardioides humi]|uniref:GTPase n=1 Tax=Nocardioides humi TaxID=449461 RepID=UPI0015E84FF5|nr:GTPase domain-containing protein [Nocardioides humi]